MSHLREGTPHSDRVTIGLHQAVCAYQKVQPSVNAMCTYR
jgi:hypothetical protein